MLRVTLTIHPESDNLLQLLTRDILNGSDLSAATVTWELFDSGDVSIANGSMSHAAAGSPNADGFYIFNAVLQDTIALVAGGSYTTEIVFDNGVNQKKTIKAPTVAQYATS